MTVNPGTLNLEVEAARLCVCRRKELRAPHFWRWIARAKARIV